MARQYHVHGFNMMLANIGSKQIPGSGPVETVRVSKSKGVNLRGKFPWIFFAKRIA
jgi:hypothetical protein